MLFFVHRSNFPVNYNTKHTFLWSRPVTFFTCFFLLCFLFCGIHISPMGSGPLGGHPLGDTNRAFFAEFWGVFWCFCVFWYFVALESWNNTGLGPRGPAFDQLFVKMQNLMVGLSFFVFFVQNSLSVGSVFRFRNRHIVGPIMVASGATLGGNTYCCTYRELLVFLNSQDCKDFSCITHDRLWPYWVAPEEPLFGTKPVKPGTPGRAGRSIVIPHFRWCGSSIFLPM